MNKRQTNFRLSPDTLARLARLQAGSPEKTSQADIISAALFDYERAQVGVARRALLDVYDEIGEGITQIQYVAEERTLVAEEQQVFDMLFTFFEKCRQCSLFAEPPLPQEP